MLLFLHIFFPEFHSFINPSFSRCSFPNSEAMFQIINVIIFHNDSFLFHSFSSFFDIHPRNIKIFFSHNEKSRRIAFIKFRLFNKMNIGNYGYSRIDAIFFIYTGLAINHTTYSSGSSRATP